VSRGAPPVWSAANISVGQKIATSISVQVFRVAVMAAAIMPTATAVMAAATTVAVAVMVAATTVMMAAVAVVATVMMAAATIPPTDDFPHRLTTEVAMLTKNL
jgi:uncharacterized membrane protein